MKKLSNSEADTIQIAIELAQKLKSKPKCFIQLEGTLGAGKTTFAKAFIREYLGKNIEVTSPTFNIVKLYDQKIAHLDLYRLKSFNELQELDYETYFYDFPCCIVEWLENIENHDSLRPLESILIKINYLNGDKREITIQDLKKP